MSKAKDRRKQRQQKRQGKRNTRKSKRQTKKTTRKTKKTERRTQRKEAVKKVVDKIGSIANKVGEKAEVAVGRVYNDTMGLANKQVDVFGNLAGSAGDIGGNLTKNLWPIAIIAGVGLGGVLLLK